MSNETRLTALWVRLAPEDVTDELCVTALRVGNNHLAHLVVAHLGERARTVVEAAGLLTGGRTPAAGWLLGVAPEVWVEEMRSVSLETVRTALAVPGPASGQNPRVLHAQRREVHAARDAVRADLLANPQLWGVRVAATASTLLEFSIEEYLRLPVEVVAEAATFHPPARKAIGDIVVKAAALGQVSDETSPAVRLAALSAMLNGSPELLLEQLLAVREL